MDNFDALFYLNPQPMWVYAADTLNILEVNGAAVKHYGYSRDEFIGKNIKDLRPPEDIPVLQEAVKQDKGMMAAARVFRHKTKHGTIFPVEITSYATKYNGVDARLVQTHNLDEHQEIQGKLHLTQSKLDRLLDSTSIGFFQLDNNMDIVYWNNAAETLIGYTSEYVLGKNMWEVFPEAIHSDFHTNLEKAIKERTNVEFTEYFWPLQKWFFTNAYPGDDGVLVHFRDVTQIKRAQKGLLEKIEQLKEISFLNSHYIRKPVASLLGLTGIIRDNIARPGEFKQIAEQIQACSLELDEVIKKINKTVNDGDNLKDVAFEMNDFYFRELVEEVLNDYRKLAPSHRFVFTPNTSMLYYGSRRNIRIAVESLLDNAVKFSPGGGRIMVTLDMVNQNLVLSVHDFGIGIDGKLLSKIFLGLAHKDHGRDLGEGLAKVAEVTHRHHGNVWVESKPGKGSVFSMRLPVSNITAFKAGAKTDCDIYRDPGLDIEYNEAGRYVRLNWRGFHSLHTVKSGCLRLSDALEKHNCHMVLNDNTNVMGSWDDAAEWVGKDCLPMLEEAGLKYFAWVYSPSTFSRLSADLAIDSYTGNINLKTFNDEANARDWLAQMGQSLATA